jgi:hypothetical protein
VTDKIKDNLGVISAVLHSQVICDKQYIKPIACNILEFVVLSTNCVSTPGFNARPIGSTYKPRAAPSPLSPTSESVRPFDIWPRGYTSGGSKYIINFNGGNCSMRHLF